MRVETLSDAEGYVLDSIRRLTETIEHEFPSKTSTHRRELEEIYHLVSNATVEYPDIPVLQEIGTMIYRLLW